MKKKWTPSATDIQWTRALTETVREGGVWGVPASDTIWQLFPSKKEALLKQGDPLNELNQRSVIAFEAIGWKVTINNDDDTCYNDGKG